MDKNVCLISDIHFGVNKNSELFLNSSIRYFEEQLIPYLENNDISTILILGDVFDNRNSINVKIHDEVYNVFSNMFKSFDIKILIGNHDIYYKTSNDVHSLKFLNNLPNVEVIDKICYMDILGENVMFCPWIYDYDDPDIIQMLETAKADILFGHLDIVGFALNNTRVSTEGLSPDVFDQFKKVFSGHYHKPSSKKMGNTEIIYVGSPYQMTRNDKKDHKGVIILNLETLQYERIINDTSVKFFECEYPEIPSREDVEGNIVDALISIDKEDIIGNIIDKYIDSIEKLNPIEKVNIVMNVRSDSSSDFDELKHGKMTSIPDLIELYINNDDDIEDKDLVLQAIMTIYEEVN